MARTNIVLDDDLVARALDITGAKSKREVVDIALHRIVEQAELYRALRREKGHLHWSGDLDSWRRPRQ